MNKAVEYKELQRYKERLVNSVVGLAPHISRVSIRATDMNKIDEWITIVREKGEFTASLDPFLPKAFYVLEQESEDPNVKGVTGATGIRFSYTGNGVYSFSVYLQTDNGKIPSYPQFVFNVYDAQDLNIGKRNIHAVNAYNIDGKFDIISKPEQFSELEAKIIFNVWANINYFMVNFHRDIKITTYKHQIQNKGGGKGSKKVKVVTSTTYHCYLPDNWVARNEKEYTTPKWDIPGHWHRRLVNADFLDRKSKEMPEEELIKKYRLSIEQNPIKEGKIYVDIYQPPTKGNRSEHLLSENPTGMKPTEYRI